MKNANYRKHNDRSLNSSTYHKKDGTNIRAILKEESKKEVEEWTPHSEPVETEHSCPQCKQFISPCNCDKEIWDYSE
jgi:hypothetical protein